jgi:hypothetical protein
MGYQNDRVGDVLLVLHAMRSHFRSQHEYLNIAQLRNNAVLEVAAKDARPSALETIRDALRRRLSPYIKGMGQFDTAA